MIVLSPPSCKRSRKIAERQAVQSLPGAAGGVRGQLCGSSHLIPPESQGWARPAPARGISKCPYWKCVPFGSVTLLPCKRNRLRIQSGKTCSLLNGTAFGLAPHTKQSSPREMSELNRVKLKKMTRPLLSGTDLSDALYSMHRRRKRLTGGHFQRRILTLFSARLTSAFSRPPCACVVRKRRKTGRMCDGI